MDIFGVLTLIGGLALFLYGMNVMGAGLEKMSGGKLEKILETLTSNPIKAVLLGAGVTAVIQSSSATTVMVVGFVNSGIMKLSQAVGIIMGANIGTTVTSWLLSLSGLQGDNFFIQMLKPSSFSPILAMIGIILCMSKKSDKKKDIGEILLGFAVLMYGMESMSGAVEPLADVPEFTNILTMFHNPFLGVLAGAVLTAIIQSSSASVGILQALSVTGAFTYGSVIPIILGQTFYQISAVIDDMMFSNMMIGTDITKSITTDMGNFNSSYSLLIGIPQGVASAMSASMLPSIVASYTQGEIGAVRKKIKETLKTNMFIAIPSFVGLFVLGKPIIQLLFARYDSTQGGMMLKIGAIAVVFYTLSTVTSSALQGIDEMSTPVKHSCISLVVHIILVFVLLKFSRLGIYAIVIGNASFPIIIFILNIISLYRHIGYRMEYRQTFIVPAVCALIMGVAAGLVYDGMIKLTASNILSLMAAFIAAGIFYFGPLFVAKKKKWY